MSLVSLKVRTNPFGEKMKQKYKLLDKKNFDKPWKLMIWVLALNRLLVFPLRFFKAFFSESTLMIFSLASIAAFFGSVLITGYLYARTMNKNIEKETRKKVGIYVALFTFVLSLIVIVITRSFKMFLEGTG
ncbi:MAG: hypothetical protein ABIF92_03005, partial [archaeon]